MNKSCTNTISHIDYIYTYKSDLLFHVVKHEIMKKLINKCICFCENFPNHHILDKLDSHE